MTQSIPTTSSSTGPVTTDSAQTNDESKSASGHGALTSQAVSNFSYNSPPTDPSSPTFAVEATLYQATHSSSNGLTQDQKNRLAYADKLRNQGHPEAAYVVEASVAQDWIESGGSAGAVTATDTTFEVKNQQTGETDSYDLESLMLKGTPSSNKPDAESITPMEEAKNYLISSGDLSSLDVFEVGNFLMNANLLTDSQQTQLSSWANYSNDAKTSYSKSYAQVMMAGVVIDAVRGLTGGSNPLADDLLETTIQNNPFAAKQLYYSETVNAMQNGTINDPNVKALLDQINSRSDFWQTSYNTLLQMLTR